MQRLAILGTAVVMGVAFLSVLDAVPLRVERRSVDNYEIAHPPCQQKSDCGSGRYCDVGIYRCDSCRCDKDKTSYSENTCRSWCPGECSQEHHACPVQQCELESHAELEAYN